MTINAISFHNLKNHPEYTYQLKSDFCEQSLYDNQDQALQKITEGERAWGCELLIDEVSKNSLDIIVYRTDPTMEYDKYGVENALDIKILFTVDFISISGKGRDSKLEKTIDKVSKSYIIKPIASREKMKFFPFSVQKDWSLKSVFLNKYTGTAEFLFTKRFKYMFRIRSDVCHKIALRKEYIEQIRNHRKTVEGRIFRGIFTDIQQGCRIKFFERGNSHNFVHCIVSSTKRYDNFKVMLQEEGVQNCLPTVTSLQKASIVYNIPKYKRQIAFYGALAIRLQAVAV